jgi:hypothetical protein
MKYHKHRLNKIQKFTENFSMKYAKRIMYEHSSLLTAQVLNIHLVQQSSNKTLKLSLNTK